ncbi:MAG: glycosyltransferase [Bacteroidota bacterium]|nr:glycosyltransferase [Bacteroidota bacterium]MDP4234859.1 glycosyltransferase [Bacteroidota bacterium]
MKIVIIGTAYPLRGGIAHYISLLHDSLQSHGHDVHVVTFSRQYPKMLFPGKSQEEKGDAGKPLDTLQIIDSINPASWRNAGKVVGNLEPDMIIFKFWLPFFAPAYGMIARVAKRLMQKKGKTCKVVLIADNVIPHEKRLGDRALTNYAFKAVDHYIVQSDAVEQDLKLVKPDAQYTKLAHPIYHIFGESVDRIEARKELGIPQDAPAILFFGYIRKYKGLDILLRAMPIILKSLPDLRLIVAGEFYGDEPEYRKLIDDLHIPAQNLVLATDYIANDKVATYFSAANVVVLPYRTATQSGIVQIAYNFDVPVIATGVGGLAEVVIDGVSGMITKEAMPELVAKDVLRFFQSGLEEQLRRGVREEKKKYSWDTFVEGIEKIGNM